MQCLEDLVFADDLCLMSQKLQRMQSKTDRLTEGSCKDGAESQRMQSKTDRLTEEAATTGLRVNAGKTETLRINNKQEEPISLGVNALEEVDSFTYLGSTALGLTFYESAFAIGRF